MKITRKQIEDFSLRAEGAAHAAAEARRTADEAARRAREARDAATRAEEAALSLAQDLGALYDAMAEPDCSDCRDGVCER